MKRFLGVLAVLVSGAALANPYYSGNPWSPIPPGCVTVPGLQSELYGDNKVLFWERQVSSAGNWWPTDTWPPPNEMVTLLVRMYRVGCAEPNRSAIVAEIQIADSNPVNPPRVPVLYFSAEQFWDGQAFVPPAMRSSYSLVALAEPTDWRGSPGAGDEGVAMLGDYTGGWAPIRGHTWTYIIDAPTPQNRWFIPDGQISAREYNEAFDMHIHVPGAVWVTVPVPATRDILAQNPRLPLNGRLSGGWVVEGATDQGLMLSFANRIPVAGMAADAPERSPLLLFLSWYTFDVLGNPLWLTGTAEFPQGTTEVAMSLVLTSGGEFMGGQRAQRSVAGHARLIAHGCNDLRLEYDLDGLGLGRATRRLQRLDALEVAGYQCRDYESLRGQIELFSNN